MVLAVVEAKQNEHIRVAKLLPRRRQCHRSSSDHVVLGLKQA